MYANEMTPADLRAFTGSNNDVFDFGNSEMWWIIILLLFGWGRNGFDNYGYCLEQYRVRYRVSLSVTVEITLEGGTPFS